jgi:hypothetical protein
MKANSPTATTWWVEVFLGERDGHSHATAHLHTHDRTTLTASGTARLHPGESDVPEIGYELATGRALVELGHQLIATAAEDISGVTHEPVSRAELESSGNGGWPAG